MKIFPPSSWGKLKYTKLGGSLQEFKKNGVGYTAISQTCFLNEKEKKAQFKKRQVRVKGMHAEI